jgi:hypothetical protein
MAYVDNFRNEVDSFRISNISYFLVYPFRISMRLHVEASMSFSLFKACT